MKRIAIFVLFVFVFTTAAVWADDDYVLDQARKRAESTRAEKKRAEKTEPAESTVQDSEAESADSTDRPFTPVVIAFTPGLSVPMGIYDTSAVFGAIGSLTGAVNGIQASGVFNISLGKVSGAQGAGVFNIAHKGVFGAQGAGVFNITGGTVGFAQGAGVFNIAKDVNGLQGAGVFNIVRKVNGAQWAGVFNIADEVSGAQGAGVFNITGKLNGVMAAGVFNVAGTAKGAVIGVVNVVDHLDGIAIGLINIIGNGVHDFSLDYQWETRTVYAGYRTGTTMLYASFFGGMPLDDMFNSTENLTLGFGIGHRQVLSPLALDIEACVESVANPSTIDRFQDIVSAPRGASCPTLPIFGSLRATLGLGRAGGFGAYFGLKADIEYKGALRVPERLKAGTSGSVSLFGATFDYWPKLFFGLRF